MAENLVERASTQYDKWLGTVAADDVDMHSLGELIGVDTSEWDLVVVDLHVDGGYQSITGWATPREEAGYDVRKRLLDESGRLEVTRVVDWNEEPHAHADTNPPPPFVLPMTWASEVIASGFKRLHIRIIDVQNDFRDRVRGIYEVDSIVSGD